MRAISRCSHQAWPRLKNFPGSSGICPGPPRAPTAKDRVGCHPVPSITRAREGDALNTTGKRYLGGEGRLDYRVESDGINVPWSISQTANSSQRHRVALGRPTKVLPLGEPSRPEMGAMVWGETCVFRLVRGHTSTRVCNSIEPRRDRVIGYIFIVAAHSWPLTSIDSLRAAEE